MLVFNIFQRRRRSRAECRGSAVIELSLLAPWIFFLFTGVFDFGFYAYAFISVENAARAAVVRNAANSGVASDQTTACRVAIEELRGMPNIGSSFTSACATGRIVVTASMGTGPDNGQAASVTVNYQMPPLFRMPIAGLTTVTRTVQMRLRDTQL